MRGVDEHRDARRGGDARDRVGDLSGQALLHLQRAGGRVGEAGELGQADEDARRAGKVRDGGGAEEGQQVVLARRVEPDAADEDEAAAAATSAVAIAAVGSTVVTPFPTGMGSSLSVVDPPLSPGA